VGKITLEIIIEHYPRRKRLRRDTILIFKKSVLDFALISGENGWCIEK
jgi:hypothetical protein